MSRLGLAGVGEDDVSSYQVYKCFWKNAWRDPHVLLEETKWNRMIALEIALTTTATSFPPDCKLWPMMLTIGLDLQSVKMNQPSALSGTVKWLLSAFGQSNNNKWWRWMWMVAAINQRTHSPSTSAWYEGWRPPGDQSAFIKWTGWTLAMALVVITAP